MYTVHFVSHVFFRSTKSSHITCEWEALIYVIDILHIINVEFWQTNGSPAFLDIFFYLFVSSWWIVYVRPHKKISTIQKCSSLHQYRQYVAESLVKFEGSLKVTPSPRGRSKSLVIADNRKIKTKTGCTAAYKYKPF